MSSIFLRIYGGLLFSLVLVSVLSGIVVTIVNGVRLAEYREDMARGTFRLVSEVLASMPEAQRPKWLGEWGQKLSIPFSMLPLERSDFTPKEIELLSQGGIDVQMLTEKAAVITSLIDDRWLLQGRVAEISEQMANGTIVFLRHLLGHYTPDERVTVLAQRSTESLGFPVSIAQSSDISLPPLQNTQLQQGSIVTVLNIRDESLQLYARMQDSDQILHLGPLKLLNPYPFKLILTLSLFVLVSLSLAIYILVRGMEKRLRKLERAATRFSRGDFEVRVNVGGADSIGRLAMAFNAMADHIQRLLSLQKEMIRGVSHELRTPVARLRFGLDLIADARTQEEREAQLEGMDQDIQELDHLVDEFLTYANLEQGTPTISLKRHDVDKVVAQVVGEHLRSQNRVEIEHIPCNVLNPRRFVEIDRRYIHRAIQNLVGNACRYADSKVQVRFSSTQDTCRIDVDDDGAGIPEEQWERVFSAFSRLDDSRTRKSGGYGLGLSIVRRIMYWHGGRALVSHSPLGGARFSLVWPRKQRH
ncbi:ATP-binding protein [Endozoicomonas sp. SCSIO W0465]|uniref:ATP-binding protein n=1 Tax=Endozoicomonas sp. SCSIO W0465 TaxID=2918516 RepID=UPI0020751FDD|nr:ATP-binding protein [Endozoicomonas sp. SCSIO W0465]USE38126.1 ATP-binding protein [Endozoicomonas sp. SCSIO W0465]